MIASDFNPEILNTNCNYIIQPYVRQYETLNKLYPGSVNTFRITTYLENDGTVSVKFAILRFGVDGMKIDNLSGGGQYLFFDESGIPSEVSYFDYKIGCINGVEHKNTGFLFSELNLPMFNQILEKCEKWRRVIYFNSNQSLL